MVFLLRLALAVLSFADPTALAPGDADLRGMVGSECSGVLVDLGRAAEARAVVLTNGHCARAAPFRDGEVLVDAPYDREDTLWVGTADEVKIVSVRRVLYATMTGTDLALLELEESKESLLALGARAYPLANAMPVLGSMVSVVSGYWLERQDCALEAVAPHLREGDWRWRYAFALGAACEIRAGFSGAPVLSDGAIVALANTGNVAGELCTANNPCEEAKDGAVSAHPRRGYAVQVTQIATCLAPGGELDLSRAGCELPK